MRSIEQLKVEYKNFKKKPNDTKKDTRLDFRESLSLSRMFPAEWSEEEIEAFIFYLILDFNVAKHGLPKATAEATMERGYQYARADNSFGSGVEET